MLSAGTKAHAVTGLKENKPKHQYQHKTKICHRIGADHIIEERACGELSHKHFRKFRRCIQSRTVRRIFKNSLTEENRKARAYKIDSCSGNGLIRMKADANYRMDQSQCGSGKSSGKKSEPTVSRKIGHAGSDKGPQGHHALYPDIDHSRSLRKAGAETGKK